MILFPFGALDLTPGLTRYYDYADFSMTVAALDVGKTRIGIAVSDPDGTMAQPIGTIRRKSIEQDIARLSTELRPRQVGRIIVGYPLNMDQSEGPRSRGMKIFAHQLETTLQIPVELQDERLTTFEAKERLRGLPMKRASRRNALDAIAAAIILESWLQARAA
ncbi:MAG: Holliday junction resolvase RuvX [Candidatus Binataceae bacterium]